MKKILLIALLTCTGFIYGCKKFLDRKPLDASASSTFLSNEAEMDLGLTGVYAAAFWIVANNIPLPYSIETTTDLALRRTGNAEDQVAMGDAGPFLVSNGLTVVAWNQEYKLVARANQQLQGMQKNAANVDAKTYGRMRAEVLVLRAWHTFI